MKVLKEWTALGRVRQPLLLAAGFFDGVHRGHRKILAETIARARASGGQAWVLTFDVHPLTVLRPDAAPPLLTSLRHKLKLLERLDLDGCLVLPFRRALADLEPDDFVRRLHRHMPTLSEVLVGRNWRFGRGGAGTPQRLVRLGREWGFRVVIVRDARRKAEIVSSTRIRTELARGNLREAGLLLGRPFSVLGTVTRGRTVGRTLGYPTANLDVANEVLPTRGVYGVRALLADRLADGVLNLGVRPTFPGAHGAPPVLELHLLDCKRNLYGREIEVFFLEKLRNERRFASARELAGQIAADVRAARKILCRRPTKKLEESLYRRRGRTL